MENWRFIIVVIVVVLAFLFFQLKNARKKIAPNKGSYAMRVPKLIFFLGLVGIFMTVIGCIFLVTTSELSFWETLLQTSFLTVLFAIPSLWLLLSGLNHKVSFNQKEITVTNLKGKSRTIEWDAIKDADFSPMTGYLKLKTEKEQVKISQSLTGFYHFVFFLGKKTRFQPSALNIKMPEEYQN
ncbi:MAG: hypothetical protein JJT77_01035 [Crocinitomicaceae bacterium]|nr:hypothetical protein [Crocinitomicaceae bacterium]